jgi:CBS domain containing-hemolysin-like protein
MNGEVMIPIIFFLAAGAVVIAFVSARHRERMSMIDKGMSSDDIKALYAREIKRSPYTSLKWGILFVMAGIGVLLGNYLHSMYYVDEGVSVGLICLFVGFGLVLFYLLAGRKLAQE